MKPRTHLVNGLGLRYRLLFHSGTASLEAKSGALTSETHACGPPTLAAYSEWSFDLQRPRSLFYEETSIWPR